MKTLKIILILAVPIGFLWNCKEGPQGPAGPTGEDPTDPNIAPRVVWIWLDSPRPICYFCNSFKKQTDSLPIGYTPGRLFIRFNKIMVSYTVIPNVILSPREDGFAYLSSWGAISIDGQTFELPINGYFKVGKPYTVTVKKEATDVTNRKMMNNYQNHLIPEPVFRIVSTYPQPDDTTVWRSSWYYVYFNSPIDSNSFKNNVSIYPAVDGKWNISLYDLRSTYFVPDSGFQSSTSYQIIFSERLKDTSNNYLPRSVTVRFKTSSFIQTINKMTQNTDF